MLTVKQIFELGLKNAILADPRGPEGIKKYLARVKKEYENMRPNDKEYFDLDKLSNPYSDSRVHLDDGKTKVKRILAGIDVDSSEILLASQLNERGKKIDLVMTHHPVGKTYAKLHETMDMLIEIFVQAGMSVHIAEKLMEERIKEVGRGVHPINHYQAIDVARILGINLMNTHTITDNLVKVYLENFLKKKQPRTLQDLMDALLEIPEYETAKHMGFGPKIFAGSPNHRVGKWLVSMTGGTTPSNKVYKELSLAGVSTVIDMHMKEDCIDKANENNMNVVIAGHISSDSLGMNLFLDELEKKGIEIIPCGGLIRVSRVKKGKK
jgi:putative NIF3 family GTP cyclohydrolase 1 type 2